MKKILVANKLANSIRLSPDRKPCSLFNDLKRLNLVRQAYIVKSF
jgi:hypothetical protein